MRARNSENNCEIVIKRKRKDTVTTKKRTHSNCTTTYRQPTKANICVGLICRQTLPLRASLSPNCHFQKPTLLTGHLMYGRNLLMMWYLSYCMCMSGGPCVFVCGLCVSGVRCVISISLPRSLVYLSPVFQGTARPPPTLDRLVHA